MSCTIGGKAYGQLKAEQEQQLDRTNDVGREGGVAPFSRSSFDRNLELVENTMTWRILMRSWKRTRVRRSIFYFN